MFFTDRALVVSAPPCRLFTYLQNSVNKEKEFISKNTFVNKLDSIEINKEGHDIYITKINNLQL